MTTTNVYCIKPDAVISSDLSREFSVAFPEFDLLTQIERFSHQKPLKDHLSEIAMTHKQFSEVLVWMLRHDLLMQLFTYLILIVPEAFSYELNLSWEDDFDPEEPEESSLPGIP